MKLTWITIVTTKFEESKEFYRDFLGMEPGAAFSPNEFMDIAFFKDQNGMQVELIWSKKKTEASDSDHIYIGTFFDDYSKQYEEAKKRGIIKSEPAPQGPTNMCFVVKDPNGVNVQIIQPT